MNKKGLLMTSLAALVLLSSCGSEPAATVGVYQGKYSDGTTLCETIAKTSESTDTYTMYLVDVNNQSGSAATFTPSMFTIAEGEKTATCEVFILAIGYHGGSSGGISMYAATTGSTVTIESSETEIGVIRLGFDGTNGFTNAAKLSYNGTELHFITDN